MYTSKKKTRKGILNPFSNKFPKTGANDGYHPGKRNRNKHSFNDCKEKQYKENNKNKYQQIHSVKWETDKRAGRFKRELDNRD